MKVSKKDKALFDTWIFLSYYSFLIRSDVGKNSRALRSSLKYYSAFFFFSFVVEPLCGLMNTGGAFNDRSIHTMKRNLSFLFIVIWQCETTVFSLPRSFALLFVTRIRVLSSLVGYTRTVTSSFGEAARNREIELFRTESPGQRLRLKWFAALDPRRFVRSVRNIVSPDFS
ncbi:hypothetical protein P5V15_009088 [Pogonomyrmex californicus]